MSEENSQQKVIINDIEYNFSELSENAKAQMKGIQAAEIELKRLDVRKALIETARNAYVGALKNDLPEREDES
tara:strand:- start:685 stop:903 length:219 start_codon:yes stop_codon:yes gene_type:complete